MLISVDADDLPEVKGHIFGSMETAPSFSCSSLPSELPLQQEEGAAPRRSFSSQVFLQHHYIRREQSCRDFIVVASSPTASKISGLPIVEDFEGDRTLWY